MKHIRLSFVPSTFLSNVLKNDPLLKDCTIVECINKYLNDPDSKQDMRKPKLANKESLNNKSDVVL